MRLVKRTLNPTSTLVWWSQPDQVGLWLNANGTTIRLLRVLKFGSQLVAVDESAGLHENHGLIAVKRVPGKWAGPITQPESS